MQKIQTNNFHDIYGTNEWTGNLVTFLDAFIQLMNLSAFSRQLRVPVMMKRMRLDPRQIFKAIQTSRQSPVTKFGDHGLAMNGRKGMEETMQSLDVNNVFNKKVGDNLDNISVYFPFYYNEK